VTRARGVIDHPSTCRGSTTITRCLEYLALVTNKKAPRLGLVVIATRYRHVLDRASGIWSVHARFGILTLLDVTGQTYARAARAILSREDLRFPAVCFRRTRSLVKSAHRNTQSEAADRDRKISHVSSSPDLRFSMND